MKNDQLQAMGVTPYLGDTRPKFKGGRKAEKSLTSAVKAAEAVRDECRELRDLCSGSQAACKALRDEAARALEAVGFARRRMRRDLVRLAWLAGGCTLLNVAVWFAEVLR